MYCFAEIPRSWNDNFGSFRKYGLHFCKPLINCFVLKSIIAIQQVAKPPSKLPSLGCLHQLLELMLLKRRTYKDN
jgi:hypothetical protein